MGQHLTNLREVAKLAQHDPRYADIAGYIVKIGAIDGCTLEELISEPFEELFECPSFLVAESPTDFDDHLKCGDGYLADVAEIIGPWFYACLIGCGRSPVFAPVERAKNIPGVWALLEAV